MPDSASPFEAVAIIGMAGRFPGAQTVADLWSNLRSGVESIRFFSEQELLDAGVSKDALQNPNYVRAGTTIEGPDLFDAHFFGFNAREAELTDPQHRVFLECAHESLESAGYDPATYNGLIGVYAGSTMSSYLINNLQRNPEVVEGVSPLEILVGNDKDFVPTRVSYKLNLRGPSINVQTGCSTSLVAVHLACQALLEGSCDIALAGGVSLRFPQPAGYFFVEEGILSPDGHCRPFDAQSAGTLAGVGAGVVVLKRLSEALSEGDNVLAVIKGSAINNDGAAKVGYTAPSVSGQAEVIATALAVASLDPRSISYVETHGTGTHLGDPIEMAALMQAFGKGSDERGYCAIGALKSNIGHMDASAGVAGLIKTVLQLQHRQIAPTLHFTKPNPAIDFANSPFFVNTTLREWDTRNGEPRRAGVSSFGIGGTNAHMILEEAPPPTESGPARSTQLLVFSAKTATALETTMRNVADHVRSHPEENLADVAYTLQMGRTAHPYRAAVVCSNGREALREIESAARTALSVTGCNHLKRRVAFMFPGGGAQYPGMGRRLYETESVYRDSIDRCATVLMPHLECDIRGVLYAPEADSARAAKQLWRTSVGLPALFATEFATAELLMSWGIQPDMMIGHSLGEYVAACLAGVFSLPDALEVVAARSRLMESLPGGAMLAVSLNERETRRHLLGDLSIVAINAPELCAVGGKVDEIDQLEALLARKGIDCQRLHISIASHCSLVEPMMDSFARVLERVRFGEGRIPFLSNTTGSWCNGRDAANPRFWLEHLRQTVCFADGVGALLSDPSQILVEVGPGKTLSTFVETFPHKSGEQLAVSTQRHPRDTQPDDEFLMDTVGKLWAAGLDIDWKSYHRAERRRILLPTYPFEKARYFVEPLTVADAPHKKSAHRKADIEDWFYVPVWKQSVPGVGAAARRGTRPSVLVFADDFGVLDGISNSLRARADITIVRCAEGFATGGDGTFRVNPSDPGCYETLLEHLAPQGLPDIVVHGWSLRPTASTIEDVLAAGFHSLVALAQALGNRAAGHSLDLKVLSNNIHRLSAEPICYPERATMLGPCKVIPQEYRGIRCQSIDIDLSQGAQLSVDLLGSLADDILSGGANSLVAYRGGRRWIQSFEPVPLPAPENAPALLKEGGVYLITGGLKGIGLEIAEYLGKSLRARLILVGRSEFPHRPEWEAWQRTRTADDPISMTIARLLALEDAGAQVLTIRADVTDPRQVAAMVRTASDRFGSFDGVIHAAGLPGGGLIQLKSPEAAAQVLAPKLAGTLNLCSALSGMNPSFMAMFSSMSSVAGGLGHVDYCGANAFLDAFAQSRTSRRGTHFVSINWNTWKGIGMAAAVDLPSDMAAWKHEVHSQGLTPNEGVACFARIMHARMPQVAVCTLDLPTLLHDEFSYTPPDALSDSPPRRIAVLHERPNLEVPYVAPENDLQRRMVELWQNLLGVQPVGIHDNFFALGGHSLLGTRLMSRVHEDLTVQIRLRSLFEQPTVEGLCRLVAEAQAQLDAELVDLLENLDEEKVEAELLRRLAKGA